MSKRVSPTERIRAEIDELFSSDSDLAEVLEEVGRVATRLLMQAAIEAEVTDFLGRDRYSRAERAREGSRNGYAPARVKTTAGPVELSRPKLRGTDEAFASRLFGKGVTRTNALESLVIASYVRGLSTRDVEATLADALGEDATLSRSTANRICQAIKDEFDAWRTKDLSKVELEYLYIDASHFRFHQGARAEPVLCAWGITTDGKPVFLALVSVSAESHDAAVDFSARPGGARAEGAAAGDYRRRAGTDLGDRAGLRSKPAPALSDPPGPQRLSQGVQRRPGRAQGRLLVDLRRHRG